MTDLEILGSCLVAIFIPLAIISGLGGGAIVIPMLMFFFKVKQREAIAISTFSIFAGSITRFLVNYKKRHPNKDAPCVDYSVISVMMPAVFVGSSAGVFFNTAMPPVVTMICMTIASLLSSI